MDGGNVIMEIFFAIFLLGFLRLWSTLLRRDVIAENKIKRSRRDEDEESRNE